MKVIIKIHLISLFVFLIYTSSYGQFFKPLLKDDVKSVKKNKSIAIWRIKIIDKTSYFNKLYQEESVKYDFKNTKEKSGITQNTNNYYLPIFEIFKRSESNYLGEPFSSPNSFRYPYAFKKSMWSWSEQDTASVLNELIVTIAKPGNYFMDRIRFLVSSESGEKTDYLGTHKTTTTNWYNIKAERKFTIEENCLVYLGRIEIVIENFEIDPIVTFHLNNDIKQFDINWFSKEMPLIYKEIEDEIEEEKLKMLYIDKYHNVGTYGYQPNRSWSNSKYTNYSFEQKGNQHIIKSNVETCPYCYVKLNYYKMPLNYNISFNSKWLQGVKTEGYGLILGKDYNNAYFFNGAGNGSAGVWLKRDGNFVKNPINWLNNSFHPENTDIENKHQIEIRGEKVKYYANGNLVGEFNMTINFEDWIIGFQVCNKQNIIFSNLIVEEVD